MWIFIKHRHYLFPSSATARVIKATIGRQLEFPCFQAEVMVVLTFGTVAIFFRRLNQRYSADGCNMLFLHLHCIFYTKLADSASQRPYFEDTMGSFRCEISLSYLPASHHAADKSERPSSRSKINVGEYLKRKISEGCAVNFKITSTWIVDILSTFYMKNFLLG